MSTATETQADPFSSSGAPEPDSRKAPEPKPEQQAVKDEGSMYVVFRAALHLEDGWVGSSSHPEHPNEVAYVVVGIYQANNGIAAIRKAIEDNWSDEDGHPTPEADGYYATAPQRSWNPTPVAVKQPPATVQIGG